ncbi:MAG TPA: hypothetical protein VGN49_14755 [Micrococcaceae bacterium]|jgi:hypothetical protein|nr:hypothetical protein [Micrococcaceae bacterium]
MTQSTTTIKVPKTLRDRIATRAQSEHVTLAAVIADALDAADERSFWRSVREENASLTAEQRGEYFHNSSGLENLADDEDDVLSAEGRW